MLFLYIISVILTILFSNRLGFSLPYFNLRSWVLIRIQPKQDHPQGSWRFLGTYFIHDKRFLSFIHDKRFTLWNKCLSCPSRLSLQWKQRCYFSSDVSFLDPNFQVFTWLLRQRRKKGTHTGKKRIKEMQLCRVHGVGLIKSEHTLACSVSTWKNVSTERMKIKILQKRESNHML